MAITNHERVGKAIDLLRAGLAPFVEREMQAAVKAGTVRMDAVRRFAEDPILGQKPIAQWDAAGLLKLMWETWNDVFGRTLGRAERSLVQELREWRNKWAHQEPFSSDDADRALDSMARLLTAISASQAEDVNRLKMELRRLVFDEQVRSEKRKASGSLIEPAVAGNLKPWREVVTPHPDVASGRYQQAEFAADLWQVHLGEGSDEYRNPAEFFRRTFLTESLRRLLVGAVQRLAGQGGDPVVHLQTNFGGGKTHSMLALYHLFSGVAPAELPGIDKVMAEAGVKTLPKVRRVVLVGNKISPGNPVTKPDGTVVRTLWGELAYQLGGAKAFARIALDDENATSPGDALRELFVEYGPCLVLVDEWVAYARQLHDQNDLPGGSFETQFTFAQALTESAKLAKNCLLVVSLPASDTMGSSHIQAEDVEVGGIRGREALDRLRNIVGRLESSWRPATAEEGFEIVQRRLFEQIPGDMFKQRDLTARAFADLYREQSAEFPPECRSSDYEKRIRAAYPIHPEIFDRLYTDWSTLVKFQRTRGVLRLMAAVVHSLWEKGDRSPLILPSTIPIDDLRVQFELTRYLPDNWTPIIEKDVDGPNSLPLKIDAAVPNLGKLSATRRVARTIYLGSAPTAAAEHRGLEDRRVKLGCVMPGESPAIFGDALRRLAAAATYLYQDGQRSWYSTHPTVTKLAEERAEALKREPEKVAKELERRLHDDLAHKGKFSRIHPMTSTKADVLLTSTNAYVLDDRDACLVVLSANHPYGKGNGSEAETAAKEILERCGNRPRQYRNTLVFLAVDRVRWQDLDEALRKYLAWASILGKEEEKKKKEKEKKEKENEINLDSHQIRQAESQMRNADGVVTARLPETYQWLLVPEQPNPRAPVEWRVLRLTGSEPLAVRASKKLESEELLVTNLAPTILRKYLDEVPLWRGDHVSVKQLLDDFASYLYLPRLAGPDVLRKAIESGLALLTWKTDTFAYAESYDEAAGRYRGLRAGHSIQGSINDAGLLVKPEVAARQIEAEVGGALPQTPSGSAPKPEVSGGAPEPGGGGEGRRKSDGPAQLRRFRGLVKVDSTRVGRDAAHIAEEVISHLVAQVGAEVTVTIEIEAKLPNGATDHLVRTVIENSRALKFETCNFEPDEA